MHKAGRNKKYRGFTLIELMIAVAVLAIIAAIAYPSYLDQVRASRRTDAKNALLEAAARQERFYSEYNTYTGTYVAGTGCTGLVCGLGFADNQSPEGNYQMSITAANATSYTLQAAPQGDQASDTDCGNFTLNSLGVQGVSGTDPAGRCW